MAASRQPVTSTSPCHPRPPRLLIPPATPTGQHVYLTATKIWYCLKRFSGTKCHNIHVWFHLKRFLGTVCYEHGACDAPRRRWCLWRFASLIPSGCRLPPTRSWATMPPEAPPPPGLLPSRGFSRWSFPRYAAGKLPFLGHEMMFLGYFM